MVDMKTIITITVPGFEASLKKHISFRDVMLPRVKDNDEKSLSQAHMVSVYEKGDFASRQLSSS